MGSTPSHDLNASLGPKNNDFYPRIGFGDSDISYIVKINNPFELMFQGNIGGLYV